MTSAWVVRRWRPLALAAVYLAVNLPFVPLGLNVHDEGSMAYVAWRLAEGEVLYRDVSVPVTPGTYYVLSWLFRFFGPYLILGRLWVLLVGLGTCLLIYWVGTALAHGCSSAEREPLSSPVTCHLSPAFLAALCYCFWGTAHFVSPRPSYEANALTLLALGLTVQHARGRSRRYLIAGALAAGLAFLFKQNIGLAVPAAFVVSVGGSHLWRSVAGLWRHGAEGTEHGDNGRAVLIAATVGYLLFLMRRYEAAGVIFVLWGIRQVAARRPAVSAALTMSRALLFVALSAVPFALLAMALLATGALRDMLWNVFAFATRFVDVSSSRQADIGAFMGERLVNFIYAGVAVYASGRCLSLWRRGQTFDGCCFGFVGLVTVLAKMYHIQSEAMTLVTLWRFYDKTLLIASAYGAALLLALYLVWTGLGLWRRGERLGGGYLFALAAILLTNKLSAVAEGQLAQFMVEARPQNPWGLLMLVYALGAWGVGQERSAGRFAPVLGILACLAASCATLLPAQTFDHVVLGAAPAFCVLAYVFAHARHPVTRWIVVVVLAAIGLTSALENKTQLWAYGPVYRQDQPLRSPRARFIRAEARVGHETEAVAECVKELTSPKDSVFVCSGNVMIYFLAERKFHSPQFQTNKFPVSGLKEVFLRDLQRAKSAVLVTQPMTPADISQTDEAQRYVLAHFTRVKRFRHYEVYVRQ